MFGLCVEHPSFYNRSSFITFFQVLGLSLTVCQLLFLLLRLIMQLISQRFSVEESWLFRKDNTKQRKCLNLVLSKLSTTLSFLRWSRLSCQVFLTRLSTWLRIHHWFMCLGLETFFWKVVPLRTVMRP